MADFRIMADQRSCKHCPHEADLHIDLGLTDAARKLGERGECEVSGCICEQFEEGFYSEDGAELPPVEYVLAAGGEEWRVEQLAPVGVEGSLVHLSGVGNFALQETHQYLEPTGAGFALVRVVYICGRLES